MKEREALQKIANKNNQPLATTINGLRTQLRFVLNIATEALKEPTESGIPSDKDLDFDSQYQKLFNAIADSGGTPLESEMQDIISIVHRDFPIEPTERCYSEEEVIGFGIWLGEKYWFNLSTYKWECRNEEGLYEVLDSKRLIELYIQSLSQPIEPKSVEEVRTYTYRELERFGVYLMSGDYIHTITNNKELVEHCKKQAQAFTEFADSKLPSLEPNQTEAEKVLEKYFPNPDDLVNGRVKNVIIKAMEEYATLARKQVIEEIEKWVNEKDFEQPFNNSASISVFDLITFLNNLNQQ